MADGHEDASMLATISTADGIIVLFDTNARPPASAAAEEDDRRALTRRGVAVARTPRWIGIVEHLHLRAAASEPMRAVRPCHR